MNPIGFIQPFGLQGAGGGARILRALLEGAEHPYLSISTSIYPPSPPAPNEIHLPLRPSLGRIESTRFYPLLGYIEPLLYNRFKRRLADICREREIGLLHAIPHGVEFWHAYQVAQDLGLPYVLNVHDHLTYNMAKYPYLDWLLDKLEEVWRGADHRFVISESMGEAYADAYGQAPYTVVTDGLTSIRSAPQSQDPARIDLYFMGSLHITYQPNFDALIGGLNRIAQNDADRSVTLTSRGSAVNHPASFPITNLPWASEGEVARDLDSVNWLYFPLPFDETHEDFIRYSMSTKLVTYLGSGLPILYHGPAHSAAARLLDKHNAAVLACSPTEDAVVDALLAPTDDELNTIVENALALADDQFRLTDQQRRFWSPLTKHVHDTAETAAAA